MPKYLYLLSYIIPVSTFIAISGNGYITYTAPIVSFIILPFLEILIPQAKENFNSSQEELALNSKFYDIIVYSMLPTQFFLLFFFCFKISRFEYSSSELFGLIFSMGISCGVIGINVAHELGHRKYKIEQFMAKLLLLTSLYTHFFVEHNKGHHRNVATNKDPASAKKNQNVFLFWFQSIFGGIKSAIHFERLRLKNKKGINEVYKWKIYEVSFFLFIFILFGQKSAFSFLGAALIGALLLESVNYIEHYGLRRKTLEGGRFERVTPLHSWNSDHPLGRIMLFDLSRHSDHHANPNRKYQILRSFQNGPQFPTGYPGMILLALLPPLWFKVMNKKVNEWERNKILD